MLEETEFDLGRELEGLVDMFSVQCINHNVETILDLSGMYTTDISKFKSHIYCYYYETSYLLLKEVF